ncbi:hypothetical protein [Wolbachia pipientis]|nr:hypothetical protein [Wolbachia pipientis]
MFVLFFFIPYFHPLFSCFSSSLFKSTLFLSSQCLDTGVQKTSL